MVAVFATKCQSGTVLCDTIDFSDRRDLHSTLDPRNLLTHLKKQEVNNLLILFLTLDHCANESNILSIVEN